VAEALNDGIAIVNDNISVAKVYREYQTVGDKEENVGTAEAAKEMVENIGDGPDGEEDKTYSCITDLMIPSEKNEQADDISNNTNYGSQGGGNSNYQPSK
jgi:hypothetical protein